MDFLQFMHADLNLLYFLVPPTIFLENHDFIDLSNPLLNLGHFSERVQ